MILVAFTALALSGSDALAAGKKRPQPPKEMKRAIQIDPIADRYIELPNPDDPLRAYGQNIYLDLVDELQRTRDYAILVDEAGTPRAGIEAFASEAAVEPDPCILNTPPIASSKVTIRVDELSFTTGSRGERMQYGFTRGHENRYNAPTGPDSRNEFPLRTVAGEAGWFEQEFADTGNLLTGLDLGHELNFDILFVGAQLKHAEYNASLGLDIQFENRFGESVHKQITSRGNGFYFDLVAHLNYEGSDFLAGIMLARKTALLNAFEKTVQTAVRSIGTEIAGLPLLVRLATICDGYYFISAGQNYRVPVGQRFYDLTQLNSGAVPAIFSVEQVYQRGSRVKIEGTGYRVNDELVSLKPGESAPVPKPRIFALSASEALQQDVNAGQNNFDVPDGLQQFVEGFFTRLWNGLKALLTLPYRIYRYFQFDQGYDGGELWRIDSQRAFKLAEKSWAARAIGLHQIFQNCGDPNCLGRREVIVAVIDSGVDYNHRELRRNIFWDGVGDSPGWDFISGDPRPYDDHAHGTEIASVIAGGGANLVGVAPNVTLMPVKAFSPYGITSSGALYAAIEYAVANGARIIVTGWATPRESKALEDGLKLAQLNHVLVVAAAGDSGQDLEKRPYYPAALHDRFDNLVVVAGHGADGALTRQTGVVSNYGKIVDLAAPGENVRVANPRNNYKNRTHSGIAAGFVAGAAAQLYSRCPKIDVQGVKTALLSGAQAFEGLRGEVAENKALYLPGAVDKLNQICK